MNGKIRTIAPFVLLAACIAASFVFKSFVYVAWYPVVMSAAFAAAFGASLLTPRPLCLAFAEAMPPHVLPEGAPRYCRRLTVVWFVALVFNTLVAAATCFAPHVVWFAWNCCGAYLFMGVLFVGEARIRRRVFIVSFHTSGSTATPKTIVKTFESLAREVAFHRARLADVLAQKPVFLATIEPQHMYGILWRVLLPRAAGCVVDPEIILTPESLLAKMRAARHVFLVTTPSFLERFAAYASQYEVPQNALAITTSGALLTAPVSEAARKVFGVSPMEIFGSTETGGVATRQQAVTDVWSVFDPVTVAKDADGHLVVRSPFSITNPFVMGDGVELAPDGRHFKLLGRLDRLVKIAEQRVSLPEMEAKIPAATPLVKEVALAVLPDAGHGPTLGAVIVLTPEGHAAVCTRGKRAVALALRSAVIPVFPKGAVPKRYRFVAELPRNPQGKVLAAALRRILDSNLVEPLVENAHSADGSYAADFWFDRDSPYFEGHFPDTPVLPGVVQVGTAVAALERLLRHPVTLKEVRKLKFSRVIVPGEWIHFTLVKKTDTEYAFSYQKGDSSCSSGILVF